VKHLAVADQAVDVRLGEEVGRGGDEQDIGALDVERVLDRDAGIVLDVLFQALEGIGQSRLGQAEIVADLVNLADDLVAVLLPDPDAVHDLARGHGNLGRIDAVGAEHRAATTLRALVEVAVPVVQHLFGQVGCTDQLREVLAGEGEVATVDLAQQVLPRDGHVLRIAGAEVVVALIGAGTTLHARVEVDLQRTVFAQQVTHRLDGLVLPIVRELAGKTQRLLKLRLGDERLAVRHGTRHDRRHFRIFTQLRDFEFCFCHAR